MKSKLNVEHIYVLSVVSAFALLFFANADQQKAPDGTVVQLGIGKLFYVPCAVAFIASFFLSKTRDKLDKKLIWLMGVAIITSIIHPPYGTNILSWTLTRFLFAILCFKDIRNINPLLLARYTAIISPLIIFPHYILTNPFGYGDWRYGGFYGDANFLALALNLVIALCYISLMKCDGIIFKCLCILSILGAIPLIMVGMSRGGILGLLVLLFFMLRTLRRYNKRIFYCVLIVGFLSMGSFTTKFGGIIEGIEYRFLGKLSSDANGARARIEGIESVCNVMVNCPYLIPVGIGLGNTVPTINEYKYYGYYCRFAIHNTYFSLFYEAGLIAILLYLYIYIYAFKTLKKGRNYLLIGLLLSGALSLFTLPGTTFMPGWIMLFLLSNKKNSELFIIDK
ncbi:hypothetical protein C799_01617 [Bacteroides thetaiotaomicron dnLKV9]|uniref:O-antigen ligase-related domain-containing protein n=1 Tax=Bacteroides thetaiotaomicron dnLKV9 TaxID=1235785 RepID=R9HBH0_BACT4|nr:O-antigen ligase family protein [Bacteroides thetaiotaomicron]EOS01239.1 hypothetical protein C799_01617 [Bacteroides thetaiotaomicron dnLKV9]